MNKCAALIIIAFAGILVSKPALGQYTTDEVQLAYAKRYYANGVTYATMSFPENGVADTVKELFAGRFPKTKILLALAYQKSGLDGQAVVPAIDAVDGRTGKRRIFKDTAAFFRFANGANGAISNLDKAYLYLFLFVRILQTAQAKIAQPRLYSPAIASGSVFATPDGDKVFIDNYCNECGFAFDYDLAFKNLLPLADESSREIVAQMAHDIEQPAQNEVVIYAFEEAAFLKKGSYKHPTGYRYRFTFINDAIVNVDTRSFVISYK